jgi:hypothetical protein
MGKLTIEISEELEQKFRKAVADTKGFKKGNLGIAVEEALEDWIKMQTKKGEGKK